MSQKIRPAAMRVFETKYKPFIQDEFVKVAPVSYLTTETLKNINWRTQMGFSQNIANHLELKSKMFFSLAFRPNDPRRFDIEMLNDLTDLMSLYLAPYFCQQEKYMSRADAAARLKKALFTENEYIIRNKEINIKMEEKRAQRNAVQQAQESLSTHKPQRKRITKTINKSNQTVYAVRVDIEKLSQKQK